MSVRKADRLPAPRFPGTSTLTVPGFVYFVRGTFTGLVKIGWATKPKERLRTLQMGSPDALYIAASLRGSGRDERDLHKRFAAHRKHGEWFAPAPEVLAHIWEVAAMGEPEPYPDPNYKEPKVYLPQFGPPCPNWEGMVRAAAALG